MCPGGTKLQQDGSVAAGSQISVALKYQGFNYKNFHPISLRRLYQDTSASANTSSAHCSRCQEDPQKPSAVLSSGQRQVTACWDEVRGLLSSSHCAGKGSWQECGFCSSQRDLLIFVSLRSRSSAQPSHTAQKLESSSLVHLCSSRQHWLPSHRKTPLEKEFPNAQVSAAWND